MDNEEPEIFVDELKILLDYYSKYPPPWIEISPTSSKKKKMPDRDIKVVEDVLRSLTLAAEHFRNLWNWSEFANTYLNHYDSYVVWLACQCMAIILQLTESEKCALVNCYMDQRSNVEYMLTFNSKSNLNNKDNHKLFIENHITVEEVSLPISGTPTQNNDLILVNSTKQNLRNLALAVSAGKLVCLIGPVGSGKSSLVHYLANITGHSNDKLLTVQLGDETDSKMMLGSYHCTDVPGEFVWQPGVLTKAVTEGKWLLLEDIDSASSDLTAVIVSLIESRSLTVPGFRDQIIPASGFQLFLTQRVITNSNGYYYKQNIATDLLSKHYIQVNIEALNRDELIQVIQIKFPVLKTIAPKLIDVFLLFSAGLHNDSDITLNLKHNGRLTSTRDLMKWCDRIVNDYDVTSNESALNVIQNAIDLFCCSIEDSSAKLNYSCCISSLIGVVKTKAEFFLNEYKPTIIIDEKHCITGRITLPCTGSLLTKDYISNSKFALTRFSSCLLERVACCIAMKESVLLVGETGTGKTSTLQLLAKHTGNKLIVLNMNQQSDSVDLIGGYKPVELKIIIKPIREEFESLFRAEFNIEQNTKFLCHISNCFNNREWFNLIKLMKHVVQKAINKNNKINKPIKSWLELEEKLTRFEVQLNHCQTAMAFAFIEGSLIQAVRNGYWVLLDEINLASGETLQCLSSLLESNGTVTIYEKTDFKPISRHPNFRLMAAMNPATDVGKKDLPPGIRNRFTEFFVDEITERSDLITLTACYLPDYSAQKLNAISKFYLIAKREAKQTLVDGTGCKPHYSLRTYCRALSIAASNPCQCAQKSLFESFCLSFLTQLDSSSHKHIESLIATTMFGEKLINGIINQPIPKPIVKPESYIQFEGYWILKGNLPFATTQKYILTDSVKKNLRDLVRAVSLSSFPVLIQGDTCVGKTSLITYLAAASGNTLVRINNHEHTDLQEYVGSYSTSLTGELTFKEGVLVEAMRNGHWIILDELNLAPTDVLEALNRVLDDNRELFIPETQTIVKAHPGFRLFATQNPPGLYGGRKLLSRAFKNRFIEMHFDEIPINELETILFKRCEIPLSYAKKVVSVMRELRSIRKSSAAFAGKQGFITLRDLFRWGERYRLAKDSNNYNWNQHLVDEGFLVLASKVRKPEEEQIIIEILEKNFKCSISLDNLFTLSDKTSLVTRHILEKIEKKIPGFEQVYMSKNIRRMIVLTCKAIEFNEPILLVGETGVGKTTMCQMIASISSKKLLTVNCHQHTESSDFLGGLRPVRNRLLNNDHRFFEWVDGPLIEALTSGDMFLADEISLADDSVLERLNSLLEPERKLLLSEKIGNLGDKSELIAHPNFCFIGTMNPGGDYGKKELSPALRNRLTEIWCQNCSDNYDLVQIVKLNFTVFHSYRLFLSQSMVDFVTWLMETEHIKNYLKLNISIRDLLIWVKFIESMMNQIPNDDTNYNSLQAFITFYKEGATMIFLDKKIKTDASYDRAIEFALKHSLMKYYPKEILNESEIIFEELINFFPLKFSPMWFGYDGYYIRRGDSPDYLVPEFSFDAPITKQNVIRLLRCMQLENRAILLEGSPGVGKSSLIQAICKACGHKLTRINLSEHTEVSDLFGADLPTDGGESGSFQWRDGPFLRALKEGNWILLDELNLASQSVLEGLNAVLDHRGELFIPDLGRTFIIESQKTRIFACQNPLNEGSGRKGLPKSFLNRFLQVHLNVLDSNNIINIINNIYTSNIKKIQSLNLENVVNFTLLSCKNYNIDMNLRDILRWVDVSIRLKCNIIDHLPLIFTDRLQSSQNIKDEIFHQMSILLNIKSDKYEFLRIFPSAIMFNRIVVPRQRAINMPIDKSNNKLILRSHIHTLNSLAVCMEMNWMPILVGSGSGKTSVIKTLAQLYGHELRTLSVNAAMDTIEILGGFEQADFTRHLEEYAKRIERLIYIEVTKQLLINKSDNIFLLSLWNEYKKMTDDLNKYIVTLASEITLFKRRILILIQIANALQDVKLSLELQSLNNHVCSTENLNTGGKFEWIDSTLVKCLNDGNWLLIDNANLCSPAVLDRLNGLLEPNGVLELGEKGICSNGKITTIKPHKDFRLFLAIDPKHGNISRAMKNRGVEIYMNPLEEINYHDIHSMLKLQGINDVNIRKTLIEIHKSIKNVVVGMKISINHLLRVAYLVSQNIKRGKLIVTTIREICMDTYVRCLNGISKQNVILQIDNILEEYPTITDSFWCPNIETLDILQSSNFGYIKQQCTILKQYKLLGDTNINDLLLCYFGRSSSSDIIIRSEWLIKLNIDAEVINNFIKELPNLEFDKLSFAKKSVNHIDPADLSYDFRYLPSIYFNNGSPVNETSSYAENKIHLMFDYALNKALDKHIASTKLKIKIKMVENGGIYHDFAILSIAFDDFIDYFMTEHSFIINECNCLLFKEMIIWIRTIENILFENLDKKSEFETVSIYCYFSVVVKHFIPMLESMIEEQKCTYLERLKTMRSQILINYLTPKRHAKLLKSLILHMNIPLYHCCKTHGDEFIESFRLNNDLINKVKLNNVQALITHEIKSQRNNLLMFEKNSCEISLSKTKGELMKNDTNDIEINLIPLWELIIERCLFINMNYCLNEDKSQRSIKHYSFIKLLLQLVPTISPFYYNALKRNDNFNLELLMEGLKHSMNSIAVINPKLYLEWSHTILYEKNEDTTTEEIYSFEQPLFTVFITNILLKKSEQYYIFSPRPIRLMQNNSHNLMCIKNLIWNSSKWTSDIQFKNIETSLKLVELFFSNLLPTEFSSFEELNVNKLNKECRSSVADKVNNHETMINAIFDIAEEISHIKEYLNLYYCKDYKTYMELDNLIRQIQFSTGRLWVLSGMCLLEVFSAISSVDPLQKINIRNQCSKNQEFKLKSRLCAEKIFCEADGISEFFPFKKYYNRQLEVLKKKKKNVGYRPEMIYNTILEDVIRFSKMYGLDSNTYNMINSKSMNCIDLVNQMSNWLSSVSNFHNCLNEYYAAYPDILFGVLLSINQMRYGMRILKNHYKWTNSNDETITDEEELLTLFGEFPRFCPNIIKMISIDDVILINLSDKFKWYKLCLEELNNMLYLSGQSYRADKYFNSIEHVLQKFVYNWKRFQEEEESKKLENDSIYKQKSMCETVPIELEIAQGVSRQFPTTKNSDFDDIEEKHILDTDSPQYPQEVYNLTDRDINDICRLHTELVRPAAIAHWLPVIPIQFDQKEAIIRLKNSFSDRFCLFGKLLMTKFMYLNISMDNKMIPWLLLATDISNNPEKLDNKGYYDFYRDSNIENAKKTYEILKNVQEKIQGLLNEWPDHPTLQTIIKITDRILNFDWSSPTCRFLIGLELLLAKLHEWENVAHRGISVRELSLTITHYIQEYRSLELSTWKDCLKTSLIRIQNDSSKWWFHLYSIFQAYLLKQEGYQQLITSIQKFMEGSTLGQYMARLELLYTFHCDAVCRETTLEQTELCNISWNLYKYYSQFKDCINTHIESSSVDIKKKLQDFIKIVKWNDINYWSVKETVTKVQQTLHKYTREYEEILNNSVSFAMVSSQSVTLNTNIDLYVLPTLKSDMYLENCNSYLLDNMVIEPSKELNVLIHLNKYFKKLHNISDKIISNCSYLPHIIQLNDFINGVMETSQELHDLKINSEMSKDKQKSQAKQILQQKRKALSELFKGLQNIGLSYKSGLIGCEKIDNSCIEFACLPPIDIDAALESLDPKPIDDDLKNAWSKCELYFFKSVSQTAAFKIASEAPKLGQQDMDRIKGFINDLKNITWNIKKKLSSHINSLIEFRSMYYLSDLITDSNNVMFSSFEDFQQPINYITNCINILQQFKVAVKCKSENNVSTPIDTVKSLLNLSLSDFAIENKEIKPEEILSTLDDTINLTQNTLNSIVDKKTYHTMKLCNVNFIIREKYDATVIVCKQLTEYINSFYKNVWINESNTINKYKFEFQPFISDVNEPSLIEINSLVNQMLKSIEKLHKKYSELNAENDDEKILKILIQPLSLDLYDCNLTSINKQLKKVLRSSIGNSILRSCHPIFKQYILLVQYFITQQTMVYRVLSKMNYLLASLFTDLALNGFCIPDELLQGEEGTQSDSKSGMGLTGGEGTKDVSDQIESQDQLEDAKKDYNDEQEPEKNLKEEENAIEMSDDFDGKLHDIDDLDNDENSENENNDHDKEMGETGDGAETLDEQLWGDDSEDENGDEQQNQDLKEDNKDGGDTLGSKQLDAKSGMDDAEEPSENKEMDQKNNKNDINDINELDKAGEDHTDPHHGNLKPPPEPEPMDLPNDLQLDEGEFNDNEQDENNPFDIDSMKENMENMENAEKLDEELDDHVEDKNNLEEDTSDEEDGLDEENKVNDTKIDNEEIEDNKDDKENNTNNDGGKKDNNKTGEENLNEEMNTDVEKAKSSDDVPNESESQPSNLDGGSKDKVCENSETQDNNDNLDDNQEEATGPQKNNVGRSQRDNNETNQGHSADSNNEGAQTEDASTNDKKRRLAPGEKDTNRTLAESSGPIKKRLKTIDTQDDNCDNEDDDCEGENNGSDDKKGELFKHVKESKNEDIETLDAATTEQLEKRSMPNNEDQKAEELKDDDEMEIEIDDYEKESNYGEKMVPDKIKQKNDNKPSSMKESDNLRDDENNFDEHIDIDGEVVDTFKVERGPDTTFHTVDIKNDFDVYSTDKKDHTEYIKNQFDRWLENENAEPPKDLLWNKYTDATSSLSQELSEQLRLVLEPTKASRLQGDFRTGKRINMRRVIPYIASQFKNDKIWLRRTKPSKRQYQIIMAVDNSKSMMDSNAKSLAFESLALVSKALTLIEAGELGVLSFGENSRIIHPLGEPFGDQTGARVINGFTFDEQKTKVGEVIELATAIFEERGRLDTGDRPAQLLVIISDGRGIKSEGDNIVKNAIRNSKFNGVFIVFIVIDNPNSKESILDIKMPIFENNSVRIESYIDNFPFPFYVILRNVEKLPIVLSDALREWFSIVNN